MVWLYLQRGLLFLCLSGLLQASPALATADAAEQLLDRMSHSYRELNYQGSFTFQQGDKLESLRMAHAVINGKEYERLDSMDGGQREIIRRGHRLSCLHPGHQLLRFYPQQQTQKQKQGESAAVAQYYEFHVTGKGRIADRTTVNIQVSPKDTHRFGYRLSLDEASGLLLRSELLGPQDKILERFQFVDIRIGEPIALDVFQSADGSYQAHHAAPQASAKQSLVVAEKSWAVSWLPGGFTETVANLKFVSDDMASFTDGLAVFSVFLERDVDVAKMAAGIEGSARQGATIAYSRALLLAGHPHRVTVVGEIPAQTAQQIAQSVVLVSP